MGSNRPLPMSALKQRSTSIDMRKDYAEQSWLQLVHLLKPREFFITVDHFSIWRRHLAWAKEDGLELRTYMTQKFSSSMVFMSLLLGAVLNVLFNSNGVSTDVRQAMIEHQHGDLKFWVGIVMIVSVILTILSLMATFTAWGMVSSISEGNAHCMLRSSIGQYVSHLPALLILCSTYSFLLWVVMMVFVLLPFYWAAILLLLVGFLFFHVIVVFSAFGRLIMHSGAMGGDRIFEKEFEQELIPRGLHTSLLFLAISNLRKGTSIRRQYAKEVNCHDEHEHEHEHEHDMNDYDLSSCSDNNNPNNPNNISLRYHNEELQDFEINTTGAGSVMRHSLLSTDTGTTDDPAAAAAPNNAPTKTTKVSHDVENSEYGRSNSELEWLKAGSDDQQPYGFSPNDKPTSSSFMTTPSREPPPPKKRSAAKSNQNLLPRATLLNKANHTFKSMVRVTSSAASDEDDNDNDNNNDYDDGLSDSIVSSSRSLPLSSHPHATTTTTTTPSNHRPPRQPPLKQTQGSGNHNKEVTFSPSPPRDLSSLSRSTLLNVRKEIQHHSDSTLQYSSSSSFNKELLSPTASQHSDLSVDIDSCINDDSSHGNNDTIDDNGHILDHETNYSVSTSGTGNTTDHPPSRRRKKIFPRGKHTLTGILRGGVMAAGINNGATTKKKKSDEEQPLKDSSESFSSYV
eukprot:scaffold83683_cov56-Attheya_sp.AAC.1